MSKIKWSQNQLDAIQTKYLKDGKSSNILVSAAAGSGKTAVLVERITKMLLPDDLTKSIDATKLLVVTFTHAAAGEMLERIEKSLAKNFAAARESGDIVRQNHIKRQQLLLANSEITTIDAYCLRLIRRYFSVLNISPSFSVADEAQSLLLEDEALDEIFSELYDENNPDFLSLLCKYASNRSDDGLKNLIRQIYKFIMKIPNPFDWLAKQAEALKYTDGMKNALWYKTGAEEYFSKLQKAEAMLCDAFEFMGGEYSSFYLKSNPPEAGTPIFDEWNGYYTAFYIIADLLQSIKTFSPSDCKKNLTAFKVPPFKGRCTKPEEERNVLKSCKSDIAAIISSMTAFASIDTEGCEKRSREEIYPTLISLTDITKRYYDRLWEKKLAKNIFDFTDIEQLAHKLLSENPDISEQIRASYEEVLMDEYQDTSLLQEEIFKFVANGTNLFTVGDMKQSIYRFRSSDPTIIKARLDSYSSESGSPNRKIILSQNFRSRKEILDGINDIFSAAMSETVGELEYDESQRLYLGNTGYAESDFDFRPECVIINRDTEVSDDDEDLDSATAEARFIASEINRLKAAHFTVKDGDTVREIQNRDIVILMSSHKAVADIYTAELSAAGIDCFAEQKGYFERNEIRLMLSLFKVINNPYCDIPLIAIMRSPIFSFTDDEIVSIRNAKKGKFYSAVKSYIKLTDNGILSDKDDIALSEKAKKFCESLDRWRSYARFMPTDKLVWALFEETDFYAFVGAMYGGDEAQANLRLLYERAKQYESGGFSGLFGFIKYVERLKKKDSDLSSANLIGETHDVVRIMTIHKSKGLEFPVVFVAGCEKKPKLSTENSAFLMHKDYGISMDYINFEQHYKIVAPSHSVIHDILKREQLSEKMRVLYVAMTRAKEKLYMVSSIKSPENLLDMTLTNGKLEPDYIVSHPTFADWIIPVAANSPNWRVCNISFDELKPFNIECLQNSSEPELSIDVEHILEYKYPYSNICDLPTKASVSDLKPHQGSDIIAVPAFLSEKKFSGASYGTLLHTIMQHFVPRSDMDINYAEKEFDRLISAEIISAEDANLINPGKILDFYSSDIGKRIIKSPEVHREDAFEISVPVSEIYPDLTEFTEENIILQGVIDCWFLEDGEIVLLDYKTDSFKDIDEIHKKYDTQLVLYAKALQKITKKSIKDKKIYLFFNNSVI